MPRMAVLLLIGAVGCGTPTAPAEETGTSGTLSGPGSSIVELVNHERARAGLPGLREETRLVKAAQLHANQIARTRRLEHTLRGARYPRMEDRLAAVEYGWRAVGENLASGQSTTSQAVAGWMSSSPHRANILNSTFTETGAAVAVDGSGRPYYVQVFARR